ncbi:hypothetical protein M0R45_008959 [Rubus argutus]|uniref:Uncharacterized protein n=1 Tax=Rubus argutus TaxID=59490 RepID=A0AAW1Y568_RUBAR
MILDFPRPQQCRYCRQIHLEPVLNFYNSPSPRRAQLTAPPRRRRPSPCPAISCRQPFTAARVSPPVALVRALPCTHHCLCRSFLLSPVPCPCTFTGPPLQFDEGHEKNERRMK